MAEIGKLLAVYRPVSMAAGAGGEPGALEVDAAIVAVVGRTNTPDVVDECRCAFADYSGLEAEWAAGTATTVLAAAVAAELAAKTLDDGGLSTAQRALLGLELTL